MTTKLAKLRENKGIVKKNPTTGKRVRVICTNL